MNPPLHTDLIQARIDTRAAVASLNLDADSSTRIRTAIRSASIDDLPLLVEEARLIHSERGADLAARYVDLVADARRAFLSDSSYAITLAEAGRAILDHARTKADPEAVRADALRLHRQGAGLREIKRVLSISAETVYAWGLADEPEPLQEARRASRSSAPDTRPVVHPVIPSKKLQRSTPKPLEPDDERHGINAGYARGCRCEPCVDARKAYRRMRAANPKPRAMTAEHGTRSRYARGCRCEPCRAAKSAAERADRERRA